MDVKSRGADGSRDPASLAIIFLRRDMSKNVIAIPIREHPTSDFRKFRDRIATC